MSPPSSRRAQQKEETRAQLLMAAREAFAAHGFEGTTIRDIARRADVATGTVFVHFPDKSALLAEVFHAQLEEVLARAFRTLPRGNLKRQLLHLADHLYRHYAGQPSLSRVLVKESLFMTGAPGQLLEAHRMQFLGRVADLVMDARARGEVRSDVEVVAVVRLFFGIYFTTLVAGLRGDLGPVDTWAEALSGALTPWLFPDEEEQKGRKWR